MAETEAGKRETGEDELTDDDLKAVAGGLVSREDSTSTSLKSGTTTTSDGRTAGGSTGGTTGGTTPGGYDLKDNIAC